MARDAKAVEALPAPELHPRSEAEATLLGLAEGRAGAVEAPPAAASALAALLEGLAAALPGGAGRN